MTQVILRPHKEESLLRFHPWVFSGAIARIALDPDYPYDAPREGDLVQVRSSRGDILGVGHWQVGSIAVRILLFGVDSLPADFWAATIAAAYRVRESLGLIRPDNDTYRLVHGEGDFLPGLIVDVYADTAVVQAHSVGMHYARHDVAQAIVAAVPAVRNVYYKSDDTLPFKAQLDGDRVGYLITNPKSEIINHKSQITNLKSDFWSTENGLQFRIDWLRGQKTGFFVDQRENRALVERYARGKDVLNMFCYTGGFSLYALRGGARTVDSVDVSQKAIDLVNVNVARNFPDDPRHHAYAADAFDFLNEKITNHKSEITNYDLIILDPPAFAKHRDAVRNALRGYQRINAKAIRQIRPGGILFTFSCSQAVDKEAFRLAVFSAAASVGRRVRILHQLHQPQDHPINIYHPEGEYLKGLVLYVE
jgi:23S rRNA (cytosine1962-C5)-methyltransferase